MIPVKRLRLRGALFLINLLLLGYLGFLLLNLYSSHERIHNAAVEQLQHNTEKRALVLESFLLDRTEDLIDLSEKQQLLAYFENLSLGMSLEYGLGASVNDLRASLDRYRLRKKLGSSPLYKRIVFVDAENNVLADVHADGSNKVKIATLRRYISRRSQIVRYHIDHGEPRSGQAQLVLSYPYLFKERYAGSLIVWISLADLYDRFVRADGAKNNTRDSISLLHDNEAYFCTASNVGHSRIPFGSLPEPSLLKRDRQVMTLHDEDNRAVSVLSASIPLTGTPLMLTSFIPLERNQLASPLQLVLTTGAIGLLILAGTVVLIRTDMNSRLIETRLDEARIREEAMADQNRMLYATTVELKESKEKLTLALEGADLGLWSWHIPSGKVDFNEQWAAMLGYQLSELDSDVSAWESLVHPDDMLHVQQVLKLHLAGNSALYETEHRCRTKSGEWLWILDRGRVVERDSAGAPIRMAGTHLDINDRKLAEERLLQLNNDLEQRVQEEVTKNRQKDAFMLQQDKMASIGQLAAGVAHEINNPMGFIISNLGTLTKYTQALTTYIESYEQQLTVLPVEEQQRLEALKKQLDVGFIVSDISALLSESQEGADRVKQIVLDLKDFTRADEVTVKDTDLNQCVRSTINIVRNELKYVAQLDLQLGDIPPVLCNPQQINQVITNLLVNAAHAIDGHGSITVVTRQEGQKVVLTVADTGKGIEPELIKRIFEPFFTTKPVGQGTGLGLTISYDMVKRNGGEISVESELGKGTIFTVTLPVGEGER